MLSPTRRRATTSWWPACARRAVGDTALFRDIAAGSGAPEAPPPPDRPFAEAAQSPPGRLRVAWTVKPPRAAIPSVVEEPVKAAVADTASLLGSLGHEVAE